MKKLNCGHPRSHHLQDFSSSLQVLILYANLTNLTKAAANTAVTEQLWNIIHQVIQTAIWHILICGRGELASCQTAWTLQVDVDTCFHSWWSVSFSSPHCYLMGHICYHPFYLCGLKCVQHTPRGPNSALLQNVSVFTVNHLSVIHQSSHDRKIHPSHLLLCNVWRCWWNETWRRPGEMTVHFIVSEHSRLQQPAPPTTPPLSNSRPIRALLHPPVHPQPHPSS